MKIVEFSRLTLALAENSLKIEVAGGYKGLADCRQSVTLSVLV